MLGQSVCYVTPRCELMDCFGVESVPKHATIRNYMARNATK